MKSEPLQKCESGALASLKIFDGNVWRVLLDLMHDTHEGQRATDFRHSKSGSISPNPSFEFARAACVVHPRVQGVDVT